MQITTMEIRPQQQQLLLIYFDLYSVSSKLDELPLYIFYYIAEGQKKKKKQNRRISNFLAAACTFKYSSLSFLMCWAVCI